MKKQYEEMNYSELLQEIKKSKAGKKMRKIHKCLKKYNDGIPFINRYPYIQLILSIVAFILSGIALLMKYHL